MWDMLLMAMLGQNPINLPGPPVLHVTVRLEFGHIYSKPSVLTQWVSIRQFAAAKLYFLWGEHVVGDFPLLPSVRDKAFHACKILQNYKAHSKGSVPQTLLLNCLTAFDCSPGFSMTSPRNTFTLTHSHYLVGIFAQFKESLALGHFWRTSWPIRADWAFCVGGLN